MLVLILILVLFLDQHLIDSLPQLNLVRVKIGKACEIVKICKHGTQPTISIFLLLLLMLVCKFKAVFILAVAVIDRFYE